MSYPATQTYWLEPAWTVEVGLRRYSSPGSGLSCETGYHSALVITGTESAQVDENGYLKARQDITPHDDPRWPTRCEKCDYAFSDEDHWQEWAAVQYRRADTGEVTTLRRAEPGAMWDATWMPDNWRGADGIALMVRCPNGHDWSVDGEASNCTRKGDRSHRCWVRHGDPRECKVTVDKNGETCAAGAGSIQARDYHGFLQSGVLTAG